MSKQKQEAEIDARWGRLLIEGLGGMEGLESLNIKAFNVSRHTVTFLIGEPSMLKITVCETGRGFRVTIESGSLNKRHGKSGPDQFLKRLLLWTFDPRS